MYPSVKDNKLKLNPGKMEMLIGGRGGGCHSSKKLVDIPVLNEVMLSQIEQIKSLCVCVCVSQSFSGGGNGQECLNSPQLTCQLHIFPE